MDHSKFLDQEKSRSMLCVPYFKDARLMMQWINNPEIRRYLMRYAPVMLEGEQKWLSDMGAESISTHAIQNALFLIVNKSTNKRIGSIGLHRIDWKNRNATTGTLIGNTQYQSKGLGSDAKMLLLNWAFNELGLNKVESRVIAFNERSLGYAKKCGYEVVGRLKRHIFREGQWHDEIILEVHSDAWQPLWKKFEAGDFRKQAVCEPEPTSHSLAWKLEGSD